VGTITGCVDGVLTIIGLGVNISVEKIVGTAVSDEEG
jgi:hypothetical protein